MTIDVDSTICEVVGKTEQGAAYGHTDQLGYHPLPGRLADHSRRPVLRLPARWP